MKHTCLSCLAATAMAAASFSPAASALELFQTNTALSYMTKSDLNLFQATIQSALDNTPDGSTQTWTNPQTKASGTVTPTKSFTMQGMRCRTVEFTTYAGGQSGRSAWNYCKTKDGWKIASGG